MSRRRTRLVFVVVGLALSVALAAQTGQQRGRSFTGHAVAAVKHDVSPPLRDIPSDLREEPDGDRATHAPFVVPKGHGGRTVVPQVDGALQDSPLVPLLAAPTVSFDGVNNRNGVLPPDTNGDVGPSHYVQWVNLSYAVYSKTGTTVVAPTNGNTVFAGFGGPCETTNDGDPIVLYDEQADRWLLSQFALPNYPSGPFYQCIAISQTGDPAGSYYRYQFTISTTKLNDYPKFGVWRDGYYMTVNQFTSSYAGAGVVVFERDKMLLGQPARQIYIDTNDVNLGGMLPADVDGTTLPAAGTPNYVFQFDDDYPTPGDLLEVWAFATNWTMGTATFSLKQTLPVASFDSNMCGYARNCIAQPSTSAKLDAISDRLMYRLQYRNFGTHESFVTNHTVDVNGVDRAGVRWYEVRRNPANDNFSIYQQGTYSPDATNRWMASAAMDKAGNIALAYNTSSSTQYPSIRYTGRLASDTPLGVMTQGESDILVGSGAQTHTSSRWGDYSNLSVDPVDGCTFWATLEYTNQGSVFNRAPWRTRIAAFALPNCLAPVAPPAGTMGTLAASAAASNRIELSWSYSAADETGFAIERCAGAGCSSFAEIARTTGTGTTFTDTTVAASTSYSYRVRAYNDGGTSGYSNTASATTPAQLVPNAPATLTATAGKRAITLTWTDSSTDETSFRVLRCTGTSCTPGTLITTTAANVTRYKNTGLTSGTTYRYVVQACNTGCSDSPVATATAN